VALARPLTVAALLALTLTAALAASGAGPPSGVSPSSPPAVALAFDGQLGVTRINRQAQSAITWRGGPVVTSTGETVVVRVSDTLPAETPEKWAEFIAHLTHGPELSQLSTSIATLAEVQDICGGRALGCYGGNQLISFGEATIDGTTAEEVVRHEYGHHIAYHRLNSPWLAIDWGPKQWASAATVCSRVSRGEAYPGDEGRNYAQNPGEAWAETYRLMDERKAGITTASWRIVSPSFFPNEAALVAAEHDVVLPWTVNRKSSYRRVFGKRTSKTWWIPVSTPLDGELQLNATVPKGGLYEVALVAGNRSTVLRRAQWVGQRVKRTATNICGRRSLFVRVTQRGALGRVTVTTATP
jgi:hypothetical protein